MTDDPITDEWLKSVGFKWHQFNRQPDKHWLLWLGGGLKEKPCMTSYEDIGVELAANTSIRGYEYPDWFCWLRSDAAGRYHRFIHLRHVETRRDVTSLVEAISGRPWSPENHLYGSLHSPTNADRIRQDMKRADAALIQGASPHHKWSEVEKDDSRGRALPEHMEVAVKAGVAS